MNIFQKIAKFFSEVKVELTKVAWSTREELVGATIAVISITALLAVFIGVIDVVLSKVLSLMFK
jgi:preprotein translocase subunit SecE